MAAAKRGCFDQSLSALNSFQNYMKPTCRETVAWERGRLARPPIFLSRLSKQYCITLCGEIFCPAAKPCRSEGRCDPWVRRRALARLDGPAGSSDGGEARRFWRADRTVLCRQDCWHH